MFQQFLAGDDVARLTLPPAATASPEASATNGPSIDPSASNTTGTAPGAATAAELAGTWTVADGSVVGYRVREQVVGALTFPFSDFGMTPPDVAGSVQVEDDATMELLISLART